MRKRYTFEEIMKMDFALLQIAMYETSKGKIFLPKSPEELLEFQVQSGKTFNYFKDLIRKGEISFEELKVKVSNRWGALQQEEIDPEDVDGLLKDIEEENEMRENEEKVSSHIGNMLKAIFSGQEMVEPQEINLPSPVPPMQQTISSNGREEQIDELQKIGNPFTIKVQPNNAELDKNIVDSGYNKGDEKQSPKPKRKAKPRKSK